MTIRFGGFPAGPARLEGRHNRVIDTASTIIEAPVLPRPDAQFMPLNTVVNRAPPGLGVNITASLSNGSRLSVPCTPQLYVDKVQALEDHPDRAVIAFNQLTDFATLGQDFLVGAGITGLRIVNGEAIEAWTGTVTEHKASDWFAISGANKIVSETSFEETFYGYARPGAVVHLSVFAVDQEGNRGARSAVVTHMIPASPVAQTVSNTIEGKVLSGAVNASLAAPANLAIADLDGDASAYRLTWDSVPGAVGYVVETSDDDPAAHQGAFLRVSPPPAGGIRATDECIVRQPILSASRDWLRHRVAFVTGAIRKIWRTEFSHMAGDDPDISVTYVADGHPDGGEGFLRVNARNGAVFSIQKATFSDAEDDFYDVLEAGESVRFTTHIRTASTGAITYRSGFQGEPDVTTAATTDWQEVRQDHTNPALRMTGGPDRWRVDITGEVEIASPRMFSLAAEFMALRPLQTRRLTVDAGQTMMRLHQWIKSFKSGNSMSQLLGRRGSNASNGSGGSTLDDAFANCLACNRYPKLSLDEYTTEAELHAMMAYICGRYGPGDAPDSKPHVDRRIAQGHAEPWIDLFDRILFERNNEDWNNRFAPWISRPMTDVNGTTYGAADVSRMMNARFRRMIMASPHYQAHADRIVFASGGRDRTSWSGAVADDGADMILINAYLGGDVNAGDAVAAPEQTGLTWLLRMNYTAQDLVPMVRDIQSQIAGRDIELGIYEGIAPGYTQPRDQNVRDRQLRVLFSGGIATSTFDAHLRMLSMGLREQGYFAANTSRNWPFARPSHFGGAIFMGWELGRLWTELTHGGNIHEMRLAHAPTLSPDYPGTVRAPGAATCNAYLSRSASRAVLAVTNLDIDRSILGQDDPLFDTGRTGAVSIALPVPAVRFARMTVYRLTTPFNWHNAFREGADPLAAALVVERDESLVVPTDLGTLRLGANVGLPAEGLPAGGTVIVVLDRNTTAPLPVPEAAPNVAS